MDELEALSPYPAPTRMRPLLGLTILLVEDSRFASEAMRLMSLRSGARLRRADCLYSARRHLKVYRPSAVVVDFGLPDGSGLDLIEDLNAARPRVGVLLGLSGDPQAADKAAAAGADGCLIKPLNSLAQFQQAILSNLPSERQPNGPRALSDDIIAPDSLAYRDDISHSASLLDDAQSEEVLDYIAQFLDGVARSADDRPLADAAHSLARSRRKGAPGDTHAAAARVEALIKDRLHDRAII